MQMREALESCLGKGLVIELLGGNMAKTNHLRKKKHGVAAWGLKDVVSGELLPRSFPTREDARANQGIGTIAVRVILQKL